MSQQSRKINIPRPAGGANGSAGKKRKHDQIASSSGKKFRQPDLKRMKLSSILPKEEEVPEYTPDLKKNSQIIKRELEAQKTRPKKQPKWKKVDVDASKFLLNEEAGGFFGLEELDDNAAVLYYNTGDNKLLLEDEDADLLESDHDSEEDQPKKKKQDAKNNKKNNKAHEEPTSDEIHEGSVNTTDSAGFDADESEDGTLAASREVIDLHKQAIKNTMGKKVIENKKQKETKKIDQPKKNEPQAKETTNKNNKNEVQKSANETNANKKNAKQEQQVKNKEEKKQDQKKKVKFEQPPQEEEEENDIEEEDNNEEINEEDGAQEETSQQEEEHDPILDEDPEELRNSMADWTKLYPEMHTDILRGLKKAGFMNPTPIQERALTASLRDRKDILGAAKTGSGKTLAFGIPILQQILDLQEKNTDPDRPNELKALILSPTRELAKQILDHLTTVAKYTSITIAAVVGGVSPYKQQRLLAKRPDILVGTPGRMWETLNQYENSLKDLAPKGIRFVVLDEADRMVEFGHYPEVESILNAVQLKVEDDETFVFEPNREKNSKKENAKERKAKFQARFEQENGDDDDGSGEEDINDDDMQLLNENDDEENDENNFEEVNEDEMDEDELNDIDMDDEDDGNSDEEDNEGNDMSDENDDENEGEDQMPVLEDFEEENKSANNTNIVGRHEVRHKETYKKQYYIFSATLTLSVEGRKNIGKPRKRNFNKKKKQKDVQNRVDILMEMIDFERKVEVIDLTGPGQMTADKLVESRLFCIKEEKDIYLYYFLWKYPGRTLVFVNSIECIRRLTPIFQMLNFQVSSLHASMQQKQRFKNLERFRDAKQSVLIATDVMARGIDIPNVDHVVHYQIPRNSEIYIHRSGRTARAFSGGFTLLLVEPAERNYYKSICQKVKGVEDLKEFPVDRSYFMAIKKRVSIATRINTKTHAKDKAKHRKDWFKKSAKEADLDLDDEFLSEEDEDDFVSQKAAARDEVEVFKMKIELQELLKKPLMPIGMSAKYYTKDPEFLASMDKSNTAQHDLASKKNPKRRKNK